MCTVTAALLALTVAKTGMDYQQGKQSAKAQKGMLEEADRQERLQTARQYEENTQVSMEDMATREKEHWIDQGRLRAIAAESGLAGATQDRILQEEANQASQDVATLEANRRRQGEQVHSQGVAKATQNGIQKAGIRSPSALGTGLQIAGSAVQAYDRYDTAKREAAKGGSK